MTKQLSRYDKITLQNKLKAYNNSLKYIESLGDHASDSLLEYKVFLARAIARVNKKLNTVLK